MAADRGSGALGGQNAQRRSEGVRGSCAAGAVLRSARVLLRGHAEPQDCAAGSTAGPQEEQRTQRCRWRGAQVWSPELWRLARFPCAAAAHAAIGRLAGAAMRSGSRGVGERADTMRAAGAAWSSCVPGRGRSEAPSSSARSARSAGADTLGVARGAHDVDRCGNQCPDRLGWCTGHPTQQRATLQHQSDRAGR